MVISSPREGVPVRYYALDGLRGTAALLVMVYHITQHSSLHWFPGAWVAVDMFFVLSGFVLAHTYCDRITGGLNFQSFIQKRLHRLAPVFVIGIVFGAMSYLPYLLDNRNTISPWSFGLAMLLNGMGVPYFNHSGWPIGNETIVGATFPINDPAWSIHFEIVIGLGFYYLWSRFGFNQICGIAGTCFVAFLSLILVCRAVNPGWETDSFFVGYFRVFYEFLLGVIFYHVCKRNRSTVVGVCLSDHTVKNYSISRCTRRLLSYIRNGAMARKGLIASVLCTIAFVLTFSSVGRVAVVNEFVIAPLVIFVVAEQELSPLLNRYCACVGELSYPLYVIHFPILRFFLFFSGFRAIHPLGQLVLVAALSTLASLALLSVDRYIKSAWFGRR